MTTRTYTVGENNTVRRRDNNAGSWIDVSIPAGTSGTMDCRDVMTDPNNPDKVVVVGNDLGGPGTNSGIMVSQDAGLTWFRPAGAWGSAKGYYEVWYADSDHIWVIGNSGWCVRSTDGGLTFNDTAARPAGGSYTFTSAIHALDGQIAIVGGTTAQTSNINDARVWKTTDGGNTWSTLNGGATLVDTDPGGSVTGPINGIWMSPDQQRIVLSTFYTQFLSTTGGAAAGSISSVDPRLNRSGRHLTWYPSHDPAPLRFRHVGGFSFQINTSGDVGSSWTITRFGTGDIIAGAHFYDVATGYYIVGRDVFETTDGGQTGTLSDSAPGIEFLRAVWTTEPSITPPPPYCYLATNCEDSEDALVVEFADPAYIVDVNLTYVFDIDPDKCYSIIEVTCQDQDDDGEADATLVNVLETYPSCDDCLGTCYRLTDCESGQVYNVQNDLSQYVGKIIQVEVSNGNELEIICLSVEALICEEPFDTLAFNFIECFDTCEECIPEPPAPIVIPDVKGRTVKPGWNTKGCPPEYVEKVSCRFAEAMYQEVASIRYGIEFCCNDDAQKWSIKKELLDLKALYDPEACLTESQLCCPPCGLEAEITIPCDPPTYLIGSIDIP